MFTMCGVIFSLINCESDKELILEQINKIQYRGPDNTTTIQTDKYFLGFHRLKIIGNNDTGNQPFVTDKWTFGCNGEIYNYKELMNGHHTGPLKSDVEIIPKLLEGNEHNAHKMIGLLDGDFAFVYVYKDIKGHDCIIVARDRIGLCPLFYGLNESNEIIAVASEAKAIIPFCREVKQFPPGHYLDSSIHSIKDDFINYADVLFDSRIEDASTTVRVMVETAVRKRLTHSDRPVGVLCSGGIDSSIVSAIANRQTTHPIHVFTISYEQGMSYDSFYANKLCSTLKNAIHTNIVFSRTEVMDAYEQVIHTCESYDPRTIRAAIPGYLLAKYISENTEIKVILSGEGADEIFAGYKYFQYCPDEASMNSETSRLVRNLHSFDLLRAERVFSRFGLELRVPFLDQNVIRCVKCFNDIIFEYKSEEKYLLRKAFECYPELKDVIYRQKECFSDGCGYNYVPDLLKVHSTSSRLDEKELDEKKVYSSIYEKYYGDQNWILERTMPDWIPKVDKINEFI
jgi:asparagine synthase (glutamine-hydrolysing)